MKRFIASQFGGSMIELLVALAVGTLLIPAIASGLFATREGKAQQRQRLQAVALVREAQEATRVAREAGWTNVETAGTYHPVISGSTWTLASGNQTVNGFTRSVVISDVYRDTAGAIVSSGGTFDPSTKQVVITASWGTFLPSSVTSTLYLSRLANTNYVQTTQADFDAGTQTNTVTTNNDGGEVTLGAGGTASWCDPSLTITALDLPKNGVANGITAIEGQVFAGTGDNASGVSFANITVSNTDPPVATIAGTFNNYKTNAVFGETNYAYVATDTNDREITIFDISSLPYTAVGTFDSAGPTDGDSIFVVGNVGYMTTSSTFYTFDLTSRVGARTQLDSVALAGVGNEVFVVGGYAYVAVDNTTTQLQIIDVSNPANITIVGDAQLSALGGEDIYVNAAGDRAYLATAVSATQRELFIIDVTTKTGTHTALGSYDTTGMNPTGVTVVPGNRAIIVGVGAEEYQVVNIVNESSPVRCGGLNIDTGVNGVASVLESDGDAYSYIITGDATTELKIIEGGPGGEFGTSGTFESSTFDAGGSTAFNRFAVNGARPLGTTLQYQFAIADTVAGDCTAATFTFVGPDGTSATRFATSSALPLSNNGTGYENPGQCLRYRAYFTTNDPSYAPIFEDVTINYAP